MARRVPLGSLADLGAGRIVPCDEPAPRRSILVVAADGGAPCAYWNVCQHLPVPVDGGVGDVPLEAGALICALHGARYRTSDGYCFEGPCEGQSLDPLRIEREGDALWAVIEDDGAS